jgi:hypothetical protein
MTPNELKLLLSHIDNANQKLDRLEKSSLSLDKRLSNLEWKAHGIATVFGVVGAIAWGKLKTILGIGPS